MNGENELVKNLDGIASVEAELAFVKNEKDEIHDKLEAVQKNSHNEILRLNEELDKMRDNYHEARTNAVAADIYKKKCQ